MATVQASSIMSSVRSSTSFCCRRGVVSATINFPRIRLNHPPLPKLSTRGLVGDLNMRSGYGIATTTQVEKDSGSGISSNTSTRLRADVPDPAVISKLYAIMETVADRVEMHRGIGDQRNNWNNLLLTSINAITLTAATMTGVAAATVNGGSPLLALKLSSVILYAAATGMLVMTNSIQPSQLAEEQRNAARLFKQLHEELQTIVSIGNPTIVDANEAMEKVLALDKAYPLPLLGAMLEKFPSAVEPAVWWPQQKRKQWREGKKNGNGWNKKLEEQMGNIIDVLKRKDMDDYLRLGEKALKINKIMAISGPLLTGLAAIGSAFVGPTHGSWAVMLGVTAGALASAINTFEHGGQVGMVLEMYRSNAGFFKLMQETIESNINERDVERRENGELLEMKVALQLGRSLSELRHLAASSSPRNAEATEEFASKLF